MLIFSWLRTLKSDLSGSRRHNSLRRRSKRRIQSQIPAQVEHLEDRTLLSAFTVLNTADSGAGSLRQAILDANAAAGADTIEFNIPTSDPNFVDADSALAGGDAAADVFIISPLTNLPNLADVTGGTTIDGRTQTAFSPNYSESIEWKSLWVCLKCC